MKMVKSLCAVKSAIGQNSYIKGMILVTSTENQSDSAIPKRIITKDFDLYELNHQLDITKSGVFMGNNAAFLGPLMSMMDFVWTAQIRTACTDSNSIWWNPHWFLKLPKETRKTVLVHELWHPARLHMLRCGSRDPTVFNYACDIRINNDLDNQGYSFKGTRPWLDHSFDAGGRMAEEDIYDKLMSMGKSWLQQLIDSLGDAWSGDSAPNTTDEIFDDENAEDVPEDEFEIGDMVKNISKEAIAKAINNVVGSAHQARLSGHAGDIPGETETLLKQFLAPVVPWEIMLLRFFHELMEQGYTWARPNRRFQDIYLPSRFEDEGRLDHLIYYLDVSGSVTDAQVIRFNSEVKYIKETFNPKKLTLVQFDTRITSEKTFLEEDAFEELVVVGRGGTDLTPVREHMIEHRPTAAIIFTDLGCAPMEALPFDVPTIWVAIGNTQTPIPFGQRINIRG